MSCQDAREWFSDRVDDALGVEMRAQLDAHLTGCADCRRELDHLKATVSLLRAVEPPQAPAGFVDRVLEAARPIPWHRRLLDRLAAVRLLRFPVEAVAVVLVASLAVYVFQETPALRRAARPRAPRGFRGRPRRSTEAARPAAPGVGPDTAGADEGSTQVPSKSPRCAARFRCAPAPSGGTRAEPQGVDDESAADGRGARGRRQLPALVARLHTARAASFPARRAERASGCRADSRRRVERGGPERRGGREARSARKDAAQSDGAAAERPTSQTVPVPRGPMPPPEMRDQSTRERAQERAERAAPAPKPASRPPAASAMRIVASTHVVGRLTVKDRHAADRELAELLSRVGGAETARRAEAAGDTVSVLVPRAAYPAFSQGLARIGSWLPETEPAELPDRVPITLRITQ